MAKNKKNRIHNTDNQADEEQQAMKKRRERRVPLVEQGLLTFPEHLSSPPFLVEFVLLDL